MLGIRAQENHLLTAPVRNAKSQDSRVKRSDAFEVGRVVDDVTDRSRFDALRMPSVCMSRDARGQFDAATVGIHKSEPKASAWFVKIMRVADDPYTRRR